MSVLQSSSDTLLMSTLANVPIDTAQLKDKQGVPYNRKGFPVFVSAGTLQMSHNGDDWVAVPVGADEPFVQGQAWRYARVTENAQIQFFLP